MDSDNEVQTTNATSTTDRLLGRVMQVLPILADLARADALLCVQDSSEVRVLAHQPPHSLASVHQTVLTGETITRKSSPTIYTALEKNRFTHGSREHIEAEGAPVIQEAYPIRVRGYAGRAVLVIETNLLESERMRRRSRVFYRAINNLKQMAAYGEPAGVEPLSPFGEYDGIIFADEYRFIRYMSGVAQNLYRNIGYSESLIGKPLAYLETIDDALARQVLQSGVCLERELEEKGRAWIKKAIPLEEKSVIPFFKRERVRPVGVLLTIHDQTETRQREHELQIKTTMIKEVHHRVKNDLQTVAALLRMQGRRVQTDESRVALTEAVNRILSVAVIHEFLSEQDSRIINVRDVASRILKQMQSGLLSSERAIGLSVKGPNIFLTARQATSCALVLNELLQNALEHGYDARAANGTIAITFEDEGDFVMLCVYDDGRDLPSGFDFNHADGLGLRIVRMLVTEDLKGTISMQSDQGVKVVVRFPKIPLGEN